MEPSGAGMTAVGSSDPRARGSRAPSHPGQPGPSGTGRWDPSPAGQRAPDIPAHSPSQVERPGPARKTKPPATRGHGEPTLLALARRSPPCLPGGGRSGLADHKRARTVSSNKRRRQPRGYIPTVPWARVFNTHNASEDSAPALTPPDWNRPRATPRGSCLLLHSIGPLNSSD